MSNENDHTNENEETPKPETTQPQEPIEQPEPAEPEELPTPEETEPVSDEPEDGEEDGVPEAPIKDTVNLNVTVTRAAARDKKKGDRFAADQVLHTLLALPEELGRFEKNLERLNLPNSEQVRKWVSSIQDGGDVLYAGGGFRQAMHRDAADWQQNVEFENQTLTAGRPKFTGTGGSKLTGERAVLKVRAMTGGGEAIQVPLWRSGIWVSLKTPKNVDVSISQDRIVQEKCDLGRTTNGLVFSNTSVFIVGHLVDHILDHVYDCNVENWTKEMLRSNIMSSDLPALVLGFLNTMYPHGYPYSRPCISDPGKCQHTEEAILNLTKLQWVDRSRLTEKQKTHMAKRNAKYPLNRIESYQDEFTVHDKVKSHEITPGVSVVFTEPNVEEYIATGYEWVDAIMRLVDDSFETPLDRHQREDRIQEYADMERCRQYSHWIKHVVITEEDDEGEVVETVVDDDTTLNQIVAGFSNDEDIATDFFDAIGKYINETIISVVGIPRYNCPSCKEDQGSDQEIHPEVISIDPVQTFFTLAGQRLYRGPNQGI